MERNKCPRGYVGTNHETIGLDILAVYRCLKMPELILGAEEAQRIAAVKPDGWYPIAWLLRLMEQLDARVGHYSLLAMGRTLFKLSHEENARKVLKSARDVVYGIDGLYHQANRGQGIGGWEVLRFAPGVAELEKTTPHHCVMEQGILTAALEMVGAPAMIAQHSCLRQGGDTCRYTLTSAVKDTRWG